jgi:RING finger protein 113A
MSTVIFKRAGKMSKKNVRTKTEDDSDGDVPDASLLKQKKSDNKAEVEESSASNVMAVFDSTRNALPQSYAGDATATNEIDTAHDRDNRAVLERNEETDKVSKNKFTGTFGPMRAPTYLRSTSRFDYQMDICKDFKETGFCGFGDSCKFLHDRSDYKSGWQLEKDWEAKQAAKKRKLQEMEKLVAEAGRGNGGGGDGDGLEGEDEEGVDMRMKRSTAENETETTEPKAESFPFACFICREKFVNPIVTVCGHYFCSGCAIERNKKSVRCAICDKPTNGIFNKAWKLIRYMKSLQGEGGDKEKEEDIEKKKKKGLMVKRGSWTTAEE